MEDFDGNSAHASYSRFSVSSEADGFRLTVRGFDGTVGLGLQSLPAEWPIYMCQHSSLNGLLKQ